MQAVNTHEGRIATSRVSSASDNRRVAKMKRLNASEIKTLAIAATVCMVCASVSVGAPANVAGLAAGVTVGDDARIDLSWSPAAGATSYNVYRVLSDPIQSQATVTDIVYGDTWANNASINDNNYYDSGSIGNGLNGSAVSGLEQDLRLIGRNVGVELTFPQPVYVGAVGIVPGSHQDNAGHTTSQYSLTVGSTPVAANASIPFQRSGMISDEFRPILTDTVRAELGGTYYDPQTGITEVDVWQYERVATGISDTTWQDTGRTPGESYTYYVTGSDGADESPGLSNRASLLAGDRDDTNSANSFADPAGALPRTGYTRGGPTAWDAQGQVPDGPAATSFNKFTLNWDASPTEAGTGDVAAYRVFRADGDGTALQEIQTQALPANGGNGILTKLDISGRRAVNAIDGNLSTVAQIGASNYSEMDVAIEFGAGRFFAMSGMQIYQGGPGYSPQHTMRNVYLESMGARFPDAGAVNMWANPFTSDPYLTQAMDQASSNGSAIFDFSLRGNPTEWLIGDELILHLGSGENAPGHREFIIYGLALDELPLTAASGLASYSLTDTAAILGQEYTYFVMAEDFAGNFSLAGVVTGTAIPEPASAVLLVLGALAFRRRK